MLLDEARVSRGRLKLVTFFFLARNLDEEKRRTYIYTHLEVGAKRKVTIVHGNCINDVCKKFQMV